MGVTWWSKLDTIPSPTKRSPTKGVTDKLEVEKTRRKMRRRLDQTEVQERGMWLEVTVDSQVSTIGAYPPF